MNARLVVVGGVVAASLAVTAAAARGPEVTLVVRPYYEGGAGNRLLRFSGAISSGAANEYVVVLWQKCGLKGIGASVVGAQTGAGGFWEASSGVMGGTFYARWKNSLSEPVRSRVPVPAFFVELRRGVARVEIHASDSAQDLGGKIVWLQRFRTGRWTRARPLRLGSDLKRHRVFVTATFAARTHGSRFRVLVPARTAAPCYTAVSKTWVS